MKALVTASLTLTLMTFATGCGGPAEPAAEQSSVSSVTLPASLFVSSPPADAVAVAAAKTDAKAGQHVVFEGRIGGRRDAFVEQRAVFFVTGDALEPCAPDEGCKTPWDYCCETPDDRRKNMATVQIVGAGGQPLKASLQDQHGLAPLKTVVVSGTVSQIDDAGNFVVNADAIHVKGG